MDKYRLIFNVHRNFRKYATLIESIRDFFVFQNHSKLFRFQKNCEANLSLKFSDNKTIHLFADVI